MTTLKGTDAPVRHPDRFYIDGQGVAPSSGAVIDVVDSGTEEPFFRVAEAQAADIDRAVGAARTAFDHDPWPRLTHEKRAGHLRAMAPHCAPRGRNRGDLASAVGRPARSGRSHDRG